MYCRKDFDLNKPYPDIIGRTQAVFLLYHECTKKCSTNVHSIDRFHSRDRSPQWGGETIRNI